MRQLDIAAQMFIQRGRAKLVNGLRDILTRSFDGNVVILFEVDTGVLLGRVIDGSTEKLPLDTWVGRARDVLSVPPLSVARAASGLTATRVAFIASTGVAAAPTTPTATAIILGGRGTVVAVGPVARGGGSKALTEERLGREL